jgi:hypothetical protein
VPKGPIGANYAPGSDTEKAKAVQKARIDVTNRPFGAYREFLDVSAAEHCHVTS